MANEKDIRFSEKKVDEAWKENISHSSPPGIGVSKKSPAGDRGLKQTAGDSGENPVDAGFKEKFSGETQISFDTFISSLAFQGLAHLGEVENPVTRRKETRLEEARETIDLLLMLKEKTQGNLTQEQNTLLSSFITDLQMRYVERAG